VLKHLAPQPGASLELFPKAFLGDEEYGAALYELRSSLGDKTLIENRVMVCKIENAKVVETRIYPGDQYALDEFLAANTST